MSEQNIQYEKTLQKGINLLKNNPNAIIDIIQVANRLSYLRGRLFEQNQQNVQEGVSNSDTLKKTQTASVDNLQDCSGQANMAKKEDTNKCVLPGDLKLNKEYAAYYDEEKDVWLEEKCDNKDCEFCSNRPTKPSDCNDSLSE